MISPEMTGLIGVIAMLILLALRMPIGIAMLLVGTLGFMDLHPAGIQATLFMLGSYPYSYSAVYELAVIPLFILMGNLVNHSGLSRNLYDAVVRVILELTPETEAALNEGVVRDVLRHTMFAPTVTGSPIENACTVIRRHEPTGRARSPRCTRRPRSSGS